MPKESALQRKIQLRLKQRGAYAVKIHGGPFQPAVIDLLVCYKGRFIGIETKIGSSKPTVRQNLTMSLIRNSGGYAFVIRNVEDLDNLLDTIDGFTESWKAIPPVL